MGVRCFVLWERGKLRKAITDTGAWGGNQQIKDTESRLFHMLLKSEYNCKREGRVNEHDNEKDVPYLRYSPPAPAAALH
jgi:hypothetical protein